MQFGSVRARPATDSVAQRAERLRSGRRQAPTSRRGTMEKLVYLLWKGTGPAAPTWVEHLLGPTAAQLLALGPAGLSMSVADAEAAAANVPLPPPPDDPAPVALVSVWLDCHDDRGPYEAILSEVADRLAGYLVTESLPTDYGANPWSAPRDWPDGASVAGRGHAHLVPQARPDGRRGLVRPLVRHPDPDVDRDPAPHPLRPQRRGPPADAGCTALPGHRRGGVALGRARQRPHALLLRRR